MKGSGACKVAGCEVAYCVSPSGVSVWDLQAGNEDIIIAGGKESREVSLLTERGYLLYATCQLAGG